MQKIESIKIIKSTAMIDAHTHCFPNDLFNKCESWAHENQELHWLSLVAPKNKPSIQGWSSAQETLDQMDLAKVSKSLLQGWYWEHQATCRWHNQQMRRWMDLDNNRFIGFASIFPNEAPIAQLEAALSMGFQGVGELHPTIQKFSENKDNWYAMAQWCSDKGWPISLHVTEAMNISHAGYVETPFQDYLDLAMRFPELKIILAHWGGGIPFFEQNPKIKAILKNVYYDTAASPLLYDMSIFRNMIQMVGSDKIIFGSDFPLNLYPKNKQPIEMKTFIEDITNQAQLSEVERERIFSENITQVLGGL